MKLIRTIHDSDLGMDFLAPDDYKERKAARAIVFDGEKDVALLHVTKNKYHKLPGGGIEQGEDIKTALRREALEEIGCAIGNIRDLGIIEEYRNKFALHQTSYFFLADVAGEKGTPHLEEGEIADGFKTEWMSLNDAVKTLEGEVGVEDYEGRFIQARDLTFLKEARKFSK